MSFSSALGLTFLTFEDLGLPRDAPDRAVWLACQSVSAVLLTANRSGGEHSLERTIDELWDATSLPVITLADPKRILKEGDYATMAAVRLLDYLTEIESLRGRGGCSFLERLAGGSHHGHRRGGQVKHPIIRR